MTSCPLAGAYFRNAYNAGDVMWAMGLSWHDTVLPMLVDGYLPVERARELLTMIEARRLTKERLTQHYFDHMTNGADQHDGDDNHDDLVIRAQKPSWPAPDAVNHVTGSDPASGAPGLPHPPGGGSDRFATFGGPADEPVLRHLGQVVVTEICKAVRRSSAANTHRSPWEG